MLNWWRLQRLPWDEAMNQVAGKNMFILFDHNDVGIAAYRPVAFLGLVGSGNNDAPLNLTLLTDTGLEHTIPVRMGHMTIQREPILWIQKVLWCVLPKFLRPLFPLTVECSKILVHSLHFQPAPEIEE